MCLAIHRAAAAPAANMPQLDRAVIKQRVADVRAAGDRQLAAHLASRVGTSDMLLVEAGAKGYLSGYEKQSCLPERRLD